MARLTVSSTSGAVGTTMNGVVNLGCTYAMGTEATNQPILSNLPILQEVRRYKISTGYDRFSGHGFFVVETTVLVKKNLTTKFIY